MAIVDQWQAFDSLLMSKCGFNLNFYPFDSPIEEKEIKSTGTGYKNCSYTGIRNIDKHRDEAGSHPYTAFLVVRNDGIVVRGISTKQRRYKIQYPGTIVVLDIRKTHYAVRDQRMGTLYNPPIWIGVAVDYEKMPSRCEIEEIFGDLIYYKLAEYASTQTNDVAGRKKEINTKG